MKATFLVSGRSKSCCAHFVAFGVKGTLWEFSLSYVDYR